MLACLTVPVLSLAIPILGCVRGGWRGLFAGLLSSLGVTLFCGALVMLLIGVLENSMSIQSVGFAVVACAGISGAILFLLTVRRALRRRFRPGYCSHCGYHVQTLTVCPECGHTVHRPSGPTPQNS